MAADNSTRSPERIPTQKPDPNDSHAGGSGPPLGPLPKSNDSDALPDPGRRKLLGGVAGVLTAAATTTAIASTSGASKEDDGSPLMDSLASLFQTHYRRMSPEEVAAALARIERRAKREHGVDIQCKNTLPQPNVRFGYALNLSKCKGLRHCVTACVEENNCGRNDTLENIRVVKLDQGERRLDRGEPHHHGAGAPEPGKWYLPIQCQQCEDPACVQACPVGATWQEPDGIVVVDYDWCIGCRYCGVACPYWARHFNWKKPVIPPEEVTPQTHYLGNRPRPSGVMEKCTFCIQRTRKGQQPACQEACPTGARIFGNILDPGSEIRWILANKPVYRLKEEMGTEPTFWYFSER
ncbi:MAG: 4Fe-4S dicluster domain-containing protein [Magnetococcales bacterium]|nr:4Fe-4S dicluster domain-containing protein [Magnetococcales bacterium]